MKQFGFAQIKRQNQRISPPRLAIFCLALFSILACAPGSRPAVEPSTIIIASPVVEADNTAVAEESSVNIPTSEPASDNSAIYGSVVDLSTNQPGVGVDVLINEAVVRTDTQGNYALHGLPEVGS